MEATRRPPLGVTAVIAIHRTPLGVGVVAGESQGVEEAEVIAANRVDPGRGLHREGRNVRLVTGKEAGAEVSIETRKPRPKILEAEVSAGAEILAAEMLALDQNLLSVENQSKRCPAGNIAGVEVQAEMERQRRRRKFMVPVLLT